MAGMDMKNVVVVALVLLVAVLVYYQYDPSLGGLRYMLEGFADEKDAKKAEEAKKAADAKKMEDAKKAEAAKKKDGFYNYEEEEAEAEKTEGYYDYSASNGKKVAGFAASPGGSNEAFNNAVPPTNPVKPPSEGSKAAGFADMKTQPQKKEGFADLSAYEGPAQFGSADAPAGCYPRDQLTPSELLPKDMNSVWAEQNPMGPGSLKGKNFLSAGALIGVNTVGQSLRNANLQLRSEPPNPQVAVSIFNQSTIASDTSHRPLEIGA
jgi:hypothetical protein